MKTTKIAIVGASGYAYRYIELMKEMMASNCEGVELVEYENGKDYTGTDIDYFILDEAEQLDRNLEKLQNMKLCPEVMIPNMFDYVKESPCQRNKNRGYWQKGRW